MPTAKSSKTKSEKSESKTAGAKDNLAEMFKEFGSAIGEIFDDPKLKANAKKFGKSFVDSAKTLGNRFKDEEVKSKFKSAGKAAEKLGKNIADHFKSKK